MADEIVSDAIDAPEASLEAPAVEAAVDTPVDPDAKWDIDFSVSEDEEKVDEVIPPAVTEDAPAEDTPADDEPEIELTAEEVEKAEGKPLKLSRKEFRQVEEKTLTPFRDLDVPIAEVRANLAEFHPERMRELELAIVNDSASKYPNEWLSAITGIEGLTVDKIKQLAAGVPQPNGNQTAEDHLTAIYGEAWRDPSQDADMYEDDRRLAQITRQMLEVRGELDSIKPEIASVKEQQETEFEQAAVQTYNTKVDEYRTGIEQRVMPKVFTDSGLDPSESDTDAVKGVKELLRGAFDAKYGASAFDQYLIHEYAGREALGKMVQRVDGLLRQAGKLEAEADKRSRTPADASAKRQQAAAILNQANLERDALTVMHRKAATEFLKTQSAAMRLLEENAQLQKQLSRNGKRVEIVGQPAANGKSFAETLKQAPDKWANDLIFGELSQGSR